MTAATDVARFLEAQSRFVAAFRDDTSARFDAPRAAGRTAFERLGFPDRKHEEWRFTPIGSVTECDPDPADPPDDSLRAAAARRVEELSSEYEGARRLVFLNGFHQPELSGGPTAPGLTVENLHAGTEGTAGVPGDEAEDPFDALNAAFLRDVAIVRLAAGAFDAPIVVVNLYAGPKAVYPRLQVEVADGASVRLVEIHEELGAPASAPGLAVASVSLTAGVRARVEHLRVERRLAGRRLVTVSRFRQDAESELVTTVLTFEAVFVRNSLRVAMMGPRGVCRMNGLYLARTGEIIDNHTGIEHAVPHCESHELYKGILDGTGRAVFNGRIMVRKDAQKTAALQTNRNLVLSDSAVIDTKPQLEIYADDVKCTHGATVGQLDAEALFYLRSRAIPETEARRLLLHAFAVEILGRIGFASAIPVLDRDLLAALHLAGGEPLA